MGIEWNMILQNAILIVMGIVLPVVATYAVNWFIAQGKAIKAKMSDTQYSTAKSIIKTLVFAAEQSGLSGALSQIGAEKKAWVINQAEIALSAKGIELDLGEISDLIEGILYEAINSAKVTQPLLVQG